MNLKESIIRVLNEEKEQKMIPLIKTSIKSIIDSYDRICGVKILPPTENTEKYYYLSKTRIPYTVLVYIVGGVDSEYWPRTQAVYEKEMDIIDVMHNTIKEFLPINVEVAIKHVKSCKDNLNESVLREESESRMVNVIQDSINKIGITSTIMIFGGFRFFKDYLDKLTFSHKDKINFIRYVLSELGGLSLLELGWQPIPYNNNGDEYKEIVYLGTQRAIVDVWGGHNYETHQGEFGVHYYNLNDDILDDIFNKLLTVATENGLI